METKHTKGKWELQKDNCIINIYGGAIICQMGSANNNDVEKEANAKLISCAPELLKSLQLLINDIERNDGDLINRETLLNEAKQLILKATK